MPLLREAFNRWWYANDEQAISAGIDIAYASGNTGPLQELFARCWESGAQWAYREVARDMPAVERFTEMLMLLGEWANESGSQAMGTRQRPRAGGDTGEHEENRMPRVQSDL